MSSFPWHQACQAAWEAVQGGSGDLNCCWCQLGSGTCSGGSAYPDQLRPSRVGSCRAPGHRCSLGELGSTSIPQTLWVLATWVSLPCRNGWVRAGECCCLWAGEGSWERSQMAKKGPWSLILQCRLGPWSLPELLLWGCGLDGSEGLRQT